MSTPCPSTHNLTNTFVQGPANWFSLNATTNGACAQGTHQSPIDIVPDSLAQVSGVELSIDLPDFPQGATFENLGSTIEVVGQNGSLILPNGTDKVFNFKQFHFHTPSEHLENGTSVAMEVHFVFQADDSEIAVLGAYIDITDTGATSKSSATHLMPRATEYQQYPSPTQPPLTVPLPTQPPLLPTSSRPSSLPWVTSRPPARRPPRPLLPCPTSSPSSRALPSGRK